MTKIKNIASKYKILIICISVFLAIIGFSLLIINLTQEYSVREVLFDNQKGEVFVVRSDGRELKQNIKTNAYDSFLRDGDYLIQQRNNEQEALDDVVYKVDLEKGLSEIYKSPNTILRFSDEKNLVYIKEGNTNLIKNGETKTFPNLCRDFETFKDQYFCIDETGKLLLLENDKFVQVKGSENLFASLIKTDYQKSKLFISLATFDEIPKNYIYEFSDFTTIDKPTAKYEIEGVPSIITAQQTRAILNVLKTSNISDDTSFDTKLKQFSLFTISNGLQPINGYRYNLSIIY
ncbi:MAG: hypothetical protein WCJ58_03665 [bacterium]